MKEKMNKETKNRIKKHIKEFLEVKRWSISCERVLNHIQNDIDDIISGKKKLCSCETTDMNWDYRRNRTEAESLAIKARFSGGRYNYILYVWVY